MESFSGSKKSPEELKQEAYDRFVASNGGEMVFNHKSGKFEPLRTAVDTCPPLKEALLRSPDDEFRKRVVLSAKISRTLG